MHAVAVKQKIGFINMTGDCGCCGLRVSGHWSQRGEM